MTDQEEHEARRSEVQAAMADFERREHRRREQLRAAMRAVAGHGEQPGETP